MGLCGGSGAIGVSCEGSCGGGGSFRGKEVYLDFGVFWAQDEGVWEDMFERIGVFIR